MTSRTIEVTRLTQEITYLDVNDREQFLGTIHVDRYGEDEAKRFLFIPTKQNLWSQVNKEFYVLGIGSGHLHFINPSDIQRELLNSGFRSRAQYASRGGLEMLTEYYHPDLTADDPFEYDAKFWAWRAKGFRKHVYVGAQLKTNLKVGHMAVSILQGLYRVICENGLFSNILDFPAMHVRHIEWEIEEVKTRLAICLALTKTYEPPLTEIRYLKRARALIKRYYDETEDGELTHQMQLLENQFTGISRNVLKPWAIEGYLLQLDLLINAFEDSFEVTSLHLVNAYTSAISDYRMKQGNRGIMVALNSMDSVIGTTASLANIASIFA